MIVRKRGAMDVSLFLSDDFGVSGGLRIEFRMCFGMYFCVWGGFWFLLASFGVAFLGFWADLGPCWAHLGP